MSEPVHTTESEPEAPSEQQPKPTETVEFWKQKAREQEKRAKDNAEAAKRLAEIEDSQKSDADKAAERIRQLEADAAEARREALRFKVAAKYGIGDEDVELFLTGTDEDTLTKQAERLAARTDERKKNGNHVPREGNNPSTVDSSEAQFARSLFADGG
jgi:hypothetical protein